MAACCTGTAVDRAQLHLLQLQAMHYWCSSAVQSHALRAGQVGRAGALVPQAFKDCKVLLGPAEHAWSSGSSW